MSSALLSPPRAQLDKFRRIKGLWVYPIYFILLLIASLLSKDRDYGLSFTETSLPFVILPLFLGTVDLTQAIGKRIQSVTVLSTTLAITYCIGSNVLFFQSNDINFRYFFYWEYTYTQLTSYIDFHPTYFSILILIAIIFLLYSNTMRLYLKIMLTLYHVAFLIILGSKVGLVMLFCCMNIVAIQAISKRQSRYFLAFLALANLSALLVLYKTPVTYWRFRMAIENFHNYSDRTPTTDYRLLHWTCSCEIITHNPVLGVGTGDTPHLMNECYSAHGAPELHSFNAHNQFLESWMKLGIPGLITILLCLAIPYTKSVRNQNYPFALIFGVFLCTSLVESIFSVQKGVALFSFLAVLYLGNPKIMIKGNNEKKDAH